MGAKRRASTKIPQPKRVVRIVRVNEPGSFTPFLSVERMWAKNVYADRSSSASYQIDVVHRRHRDAVAALVWRRTRGRVEFLTRSVLRPAAYFRSPPGPLFFEEIVAGLLEDGEVSWRKIQGRARAEIEEEGGLVIAASAVRKLGSPIYVAPGILSERIYLVAVDVTGLRQSAPRGDGSFLEDGARLRWRSVSAMRNALASGAICDAKSEIAFARFTAQR